MYICLFLPIFILLLVFAIVSFFVIFCHCCDKKVSLSGQKTLNYWTRIQLFKIFNGFEMITVLVLRIFSFSSDFIMGAYCMSYSA